VSQIPLNENQELQECDRATNYDDQFYGPNRRCEKAFNANVEIRLIGFDE